MKAYVYEMSKCCLCIIETNHMWGKNSDHLSSRRAVGGKLRRSVRGRISRITRETIYSGMNMMTRIPAEMVMMPFKMWFENRSDIIVRNARSKGTAVIKIADTLQSHLSAAVGKVNDQGMKWMAPKRANTPIMIQNEGRVSRTFFFSAGE